MIPKIAGEEGKQTYDFAALSERLKRIKMKYVESETMMVIPDKTVAYRDMVKTMDAGRAMTVELSGKKRRVKLFPLVVVSSMVE